MNAKISVFVICVEVIMYLLSYNLHYCTFKVCGEVTYAGKTKTKFLYRFSSIKANIKLSGRKSKNTPETFPQSLLSGWSFGDLVN